MRRYNYGQNFQAMQSSKISVLTPLAFLEVAPGDTMTGKFTANNWSDTTSKPIMNRTYQDVYCFYVPYRLLWDEWTDFISQNPGDAIPNIPTTGGQVTDFFFEYPTDAGGGCAAWSRRAYNLIWNKFFRLDAYQPEVSLDNNIGLQVSQRDSTFHEAVWPDGVIPDHDVTIDVTGETVSIDALRRGFAQDRWDKTRQYYGSKYVDYLAALGIKTGWAIAEEPELVGKAAKDWNFRTVNATATLAEPNPSQTLGDPAGYFEGVSSCRIRPTFAPEHGLIYMVGVTKMDLPNTSGQLHPALAKITSTDAGRSKYYSPEFETEKIAKWQQTIFGQNNPGSFDVEARVFEDYRKPSNMHAKWTGVTDESLLYYASYSNPTAQVEDYRTIPLSVFDNLFTGNMGGSANVHYTTSTEVRMLRKSPIRPPQRITGVS